MRTVLAEDELSLFKGNIRATVSALNETSRGVFGDKHCSGA